MLLRRAALGLLAAAALGIAAWWALGSLAGVPGSGPTLDPSRPRPQGGVYVVAVTEPGDLDPFTTAGAVARRYVLRYTHDTLRELDPADGRVRNALATHVEELEPGRRYRVHLRTDARFADGSPVRATDVAFTWRAATDPALPATGALARALRRVAAVHVESDHVLEILLRDFSPFGFDPVAVEWLVVSERHVRARIATLAAAAGVSPPQGPHTPGFAEWLARIEEPGPGSGPYVLRPGAWRRGQDLTLVQNPHSWRRRARPLHWNLAGIRLRFVPDAATRLALARRQELDWLSAPDPEDLLRRHPSLAAWFRPLRFDHLHLGHVLVVWNLRRPPLDRPEVRRALARCFDRVAIARDLMHGAGRPAASWFKEPSEQAPELRPITFAPERAARELRAAGIDAGWLRVGLVHASTEDLHRRIVELARPAFARAGVELAPEPLVWSAMLARLRSREFDAMLLVVGHDKWKDPYDNFHSSQSEAGNWSGYADAEADALMERARRERDETVRAELRRRLDRILFRDQPVSVLVDPLVAGVLHRRFRDAEPGRLGLVPERWWVPPARRRH